MSVSIGDVSGGSQVAVGNYIVQIGRVEGSIVNILNEAPPPPRLRPQPVELRRKPFPGLLDRLNETAAAVEALKSQQSVECTGEPGSGKTTLLRHIASQTQVADTFPAGIVQLQVNQQSASDLLKSIFDAFYICDFPIKPTETEIRHYLNSVNALILLDNVRIGVNEIETLMTFAPGCTFIAVTEARILLGEVLELPVKGLPTDDAVVLFKRELGRPLLAEEESGARSICESVACLPRPVLRAAHEARAQNRSLLAVVSESKLTPDDPRLAAAEIKSTSEDEKKVLAALAVFTGVAVAAEHVTAIAGVADAQPILDALEARSLVQSHEQRYSLASDLNAEKPGDEKHWFARALSHFLSWTEENRRRPTLIANSAEAIELLIKQAAAAGLWDEVKRLGHASEEALTLSGKWDMWANVLEQMRAAAQAQNDRAGSGWALHQLGTRALCHGDRSTAEAALKDALGIRERLGDVTGAAVTRHNLNLLLLPLPSEPENNNNNDGGGGVGSGSTPLWLKVGVFSLVGLAVLTTLLVWFFLKPKPPDNAPRIASFSVNPATIPSNGEAQLCYEVENAASVRIEPGIGERKPVGKECLNVMPAETLTYTLTAVANDGRTTTQQITLTVEAPAPPPKAEIAQFAVERENGPGGANDVRFRLCYEVHNAAHAEIDNNVGAVVLGRPNCQPITPQQTTTYTLSVTGPDGITITREATADATKPPAPIPQIGPIRALPEQVVDNGMSQLCFELTNVETFLVDPGGRPVRVTKETNCVNVRPLKTTTYTVRARNSEGVEVGQTKTITVVLSPKIVDFSVKPQTIKRGQSVSVCYQVENATSVNIVSDETRTRPAQSGKRVCVQHTPRTSTMYELTAFNDSGLSSQTLKETVTIELKHASILFFKASSAKITRGEPVTLCYGVTDAMRTTVPPIRRDFPNSDNHCFPDSPKESTTYTLRAMGEDLQTETRDLSVTVEEPPQPQTPPVRITRFEIARGPQLCYALENASSARIDPKIGALRNLTRGCSKLPSLDQQTYTLTATGADGKTDTKSVTVEAQPQPQTPPVRIKRFELNPTMVHGTQLCYTLENASSARIDPKIGVLRNLTTGCPRVPSLDQQTYTLTATGADGKTDTKSVTFTPPERPKDLPIGIISFTGPRQPIKPKTEAKLCYSTLGEGKAEILPQPGAVTPSLKNCVSVFPDKTTRYTLRVFDSQGQQRSKTVTVTVQRQDIIQ